MNLQFQKYQIKSKTIPGNFLGLRRGTNFAPIANAIAGPNINPLASTPGMQVHVMSIKKKKRKQFEGERTQTYYRN